MYRQLPQVVKYSLKVFEIQQFTILLVRILYKNTSSDFKFKLDYNEDEIYLSG